MAPLAGGHSRGKGRAAPRHLGGVILIRLRPSLSWSGSYLVCPSTLRVTPSLVGRLQPQLLRTLPGKSPGRSRLCARNRSEPRLPSREGAGGPAAVSTCREIRAVLQPLRLPELAPLHPPARLSSARPPIGARQPESPLPRPRPSPARSRPLAPPAPPLPAFLPLPLPSCPPFIPQVLLSSLRRTWPAGEVRGILRAGAGRRVQSRRPRGGADRPTRPCSPAPASPCGHPDLHPVLAPAPPPPARPARSSPTGPSARCALEANAG